MVKINPLKSILTIWVLGLLLLTASCGKVENPEAASDSENISTGSASNVPVISVIADQTINEEGTTGDLAFTVIDGDTASANLTVSASTSNTTLVPSLNIVLGGSGEYRTINITPASDENGTVTITLIVSDGTNSTISSFLLTVTSENDPPTIDPITNKYTTGTEVVSFTIADTESDVTALTTTAVSDNQILVPALNISISGTTGTRTLTMTVVGSGSATITVTVSDGTDSASTSFQLITSACTSSSSGSVLSSATFSGDSDCGNADDDIIIASGHVVTWDGIGGPLSGNIEIQTGGTLQITGIGNITGTVDLAGGTLDINNNVTISDSITQTASSTVDILNTKTLTYNVGALDIGAFGAYTLTFAGAGTLNNSAGVLRDRKSVV